MTIQQILDAVGRAAQPNVTKQNACNFLDANSR
jgi:hypothetical protein